MTRTRHSAAVQRIDVALGARSHSVHTGLGVRSLLAGLVRGFGARRAAVVSARPSEEAPDPGVPALQLSLRDGEEHKTLSTLEWLCGEFAAFGLTRTDVVVSCDDGTTTDTVGLAAALYQSGVPVIYLPPPCSPRSMRASAARRR